MYIRNRFWVFLGCLLVSAVSCDTTSPKIESISTGNFSSTWKVPFEGSDSEPVVHAGTIYIGSFDGSVYAIDPKGGKKIWGYQTGIGLTSGPEIILAPGKTFEDQLDAALTVIEKKGKGKREIDATPVIKDGSVYVGSKDGNFYALDAKTGKLRWATDIKHMISRKALVLDEAILVHAVGMSPPLDAIYALDKNDGQVIWSTEGKGSATYPSVNGNVAYYGLRDLVLPVTDMKSLFQPVDKTSVSINAVEISTGTLLWTQKFHGSPPKETFISPNHVYISLFSGGGFIKLPDNKGLGSAAYTIDVYALSTSSGKMVWKFSAGPYSAPYDIQLLTGQDHLYFVSPQGVYAVNNNTGKQDWFLEGTFYFNKIILGEFLYVHGDSSRKDNGLYAIDTKTGKVIWNYRDKNLFYTLLHGDTLYASAEESLVALNSTTGKKLWKFKTGGFFKTGPNVSASPVLFDNQVIFPTSTNMIWGRDSIQGHLYSIDAVTGKVE